MAWGQPHVPKVPDLMVWGSECLACANATPDSQECDNCKSDAHTTPLWIAKDRVYLDEQTLDT